MKPMTLQELVYEMIDARREYAAANGFVATDDEIVASIRASLIKMMSEAAK